MPPKKLKLIKTALIAALFILAAGYVLFQFVRQNVDPYETEMAEKISLREDYHSTANIFMDERYVRANTNGSVKYLIGDGERVGKNDALCDIYVNDVLAEDIITEQRYTDKLNTYKRSNSVVVSAANDLEFFDTLIHGDYMSLLASLNSGDYTEAGSFANETLIDMNKRLLVSGKVDSYDDKITEYTLKINELKARAETPDEVVSSETSGYFFSETDGYEEIFLPELLDVLTIEDHRALMKLPAGSVPEKTVGKISTDYGWYYTCEVSAELSATLTIDKYYDVCFDVNDGRSVRSLLKKKIEQPKFDVAVLIFRVTGFPVDFNYKRNQSITLTASQIEGVKVPTEAVRAIDGKTGVYVIENNTILFKQLDVLYSNNSYYISAIKSNDDENFESYVDIGDRIIISGKDIYEGKKIE